MTPKLSPNLLGVARVKGSPFAPGEVRQGTIVELFDGDQESALIEVSDDQGMPVAFVRRGFDEIEQVMGEAKVPQQDSTTEAQQYFESALLFLQNRHHQQAKEQFLKAFSVEPNLRGLLLKATNELAAKGSFDSAIAVYTMLLEISPDYNLARENLAIAQMNRGIGLARHGLFQQGMEAFLKALAIGPSPFTSDAIRNNILATYTQLGLLYSKTNQYQLALECFQKAFELEPSDVSRKNLAVAMIAVSTASFADRATEARSEIFREPLLMGLSLSECLTAFGASLAGLGRDEDARRALALAIEADANNKVARHNLEVLSAQEASEAQPGVQAGFIPIETYGRVNVGENVA